MRGRRKGMSRGPDGYVARAAVREISDAATTQALTGQVTMRALRDGLVARYFGQKVHLQTLAAKVGVHPNTVTKHNGLIIGWLRGTRAVKKGGEWTEGVEGQEALALAGAEHLLHGVCGDN